MHKPPQVCVHMYVVGFGISGVEGGDMGSCVSVVLLMRQGWKEEVKRQEAPVFESLQKKKQPQSN